MVKRVHTTYTKFKLIKTNTYEGINHPETRDQSWLRVCGNAEWKEYEKRGQAMLEKYLAARLKHVQNWIKGNKQ